MKEHLHLFTDVKERLPKSLTIGFAWRNDQALSGMFFTHSRKGPLIDLGGGRTESYTHWLDLSALTTKHKAADAIEEATKEAYENCEWIYERDAVVKKWIDWL